MKNYQKQKCFVVQTNQCNSGCKTKATRQYESSATEYNGTTNNSTGKCSNVQRVMAVD